MQVFQKIGRCLFRFLAGKVLAHRFALAFFGRAGIPHIGEFDDMPAELGADGAADLAGR